MMKGSRNVFQNRVEACDRNGFVEWPDTAVSQFFKSVLTFFAAGGATAII